MTGQPTVARIKVLLATSSVRLRARLASALRAGDRAQIVAETADGRSAIDRCVILRPDVVVLDSRLAAVSGPEVVQHLMERCPTPILVIATGDVSSARDCLAAGAIDVLAGPATTSAEGTREWDRALVAEVSVVARIRVITQRRRPERTPPADQNRQQGNASRYSLVAIGASTGGPAAVAAVLSSLPRPFSLPLLLVMHVNEPFDPSLARWLADVTGHLVRPAEHGEPLAAATGQVITAPAGRHLAVAGSRLILTAAPKRHSCRPSVDVLFDSVATEYGPKAAACLLTGMGHDGATGLLAIRAAGGLTIAQDEATSVVYGMPAEAARLGAAQRILPIDRIGPAINAVAATNVSVR